MSIRFGAHPAERVAAMMQSMLGQDVAVASSAIGMASVGLLPSEVSAIENAVPARRREFTTGRLLARQAMTELRWPKHPIPQAADRSPIWPNGLVGSISHCKTICVAAVARVTHAQSMGIDIEPLAPLDTDLMPIVCTQAEINWLACHSAKPQGLLAKAIFSAKEAVYKAQHPLTGVVLDFHDLHITLDTKEHSFVARFRKAAGPYAPNDVLLGRFAMDSDHIATAIILPSKDHRA